MIEISHAQARWLIRLELDRPIPEEQWNALQAHLECCLDCQAYRGQVSTLEKDLRRGLRARWSAVRQLPGRTMAEQILGFRRRRTAHRRDLVYAWLAILAGLLLFGLLAYARTNRPPSASANPVAAATAPTVAVAAVSPTPTVGPQFQGLVAFSAATANRYAGAPDGAPGGPTHIFLLEVGPAGKTLTDLTPGLSSAIEPAWSPDGQWLAFLSNQGRQGPDAGYDIYVISLAGTRLTRLTADPQMDWSGPLSWSPDGLSIAALGARRADGGLARRPGTWIYLVSWDGTPPRLLPQTHGARLPRFAPRGRRLAYQAPLEGTAPAASELRIYDDFTGQTLKVTGDPDFPPRLEENARFDWSPGGSELLYMDHNDRPDPNFPQGVAEVRQTVGLDELLSPASAPGPVDPVVHSIAVLTYAPEQDALSVAWTPSDRLLLVEPVEGPGSLPNTAALVALDGLSVNPGPRYSLDPIPAPPLRVQGGLSGDNEQAGWLVIAGRPPDEAQAGIYALRLPDRAERGTPPALLRLLDLPAGAGDLRVRPAWQGPTGEGPAPVIDPVAARPLEHGAASDLPPAELLGRVWAALPGKAGLVHLKADGSGWEQVNHSPGFCPRVSPDGSWVAFVAFRPGDSERSDIYLMDADGQNLTQLTRLQNLPDPDNPSAARPQKAQYDCPVWSPDGARLAAWLDAGEREYLAIIPAAAARGGDPGSPVLTRYFSLISTGARAAPQWTPDSTHVVLSIQTENYYAPEIISQDVTSGETSRLLRSDGWHSVGSLAVAQENGWLAFTALSLTPGFGYHTDLYVLGRQEGPFARAVDLGAELAWAMNNPAGPLAWRGDHHSASQPDTAGRSVTQVTLNPGFIGFYLYGGPRRYDQATLLVYDLAGGRLLPLFSLEEPLLAAAWSPDGQWVIYATPSGVWCLNVPAALAGQPSPAWLGNEQVEDLDWH